MRIAWTEATAKAAAARIAAVIETMRIGSVIVEGICSKGLHRVQRLIKLDNSSLLREVAHGVAAIYHLAGDLAIDRL